MLLGFAIRNSSNVYIIENEEQCYMSMIDESWLWHRRMGHLNFYNIMKVSKKEVVRDFSKILKPLNSVCKHCQHGNLQLMPSSKQKNIQPHILRK